MAGIGFELRRVASLGNARGLFQATLSGIMIVAGPWLISILTILILQQPVLGIPIEFRKLFIASTINIYAFSLVISGGFQYIFTRILSDYLFQNEMDKAMGFTVRSILVSTIFLIPIAWGLQRGFLHSGTIGILHKAAFILLFVVINHIWLLMLTASAMKRYNQLLLVYAIGIGSSLMFMKGAMVFFGNQALFMGYSLGQALLFLLLFSYLLKEMGYTSVPIARTLYRYSKRYATLLMTGFFYYGALWSDKMIFWAYRGEAITGTNMKLYPVYDTIVYYTNLMMIPGLVFFVIFSETEFFLTLKKFLYNLSRKPLKHIRASQYQLKKTTRFILGEQVALQACVTLLFLTVAWFRPEMQKNFPIVTATALSIMVLGIFLTVMNFLFYLELYREAFRGIIVFFTINTGGALLSPVIPFFSIPGVSSLTACTAGTILIVLHLFRALQTLDHIIYANNVSNNLRKNRGK